MRPPPIAILRRIGLIFGLLLTLTACGAPVEVTRVDLRAAYQEINRTALSGDQLSEATRTVLRRAALLDSFNAYPDETIAALRAQAVATGMQWQDLYALAEMNYEQGRRTKSKTHLLAAALYAYAVLFPAAPAERPVRTARSSSMRMISTTWHSPWCSAAPAPKAPPRCKAAGINCRSAG